jgi:mannan endo-1,4-beta-mannosidase
MTIKQHTILFILLGLLVLKFPLLSVGKDNFIRVKDGALILDGKPYSFIGVNTYWLTIMAARGDSEKVIEIFETASRLGLRCIRTWGFYDGNPADNPYALQYGPEQYNEQSLRALDWVIARAGEYGIRLIIPFVNNWDDYGGMNQYVRWYAERYSSGGMLSKEQTAESVHGPGGRTYRVNVAPGFVHDNFYRIGEIKEWYKSYIEMIITRRNSINGVAYRDDPTILGWELANEPRSSDESGMLVFSWCIEIASFIKSLDANHLVATGEEGFDITPDGYSPGTAYGNREWLFDGTAGTSYTLNLGISDIDIGTFHLYVDLWGVPLSAAHSWIYDHISIAGEKKKPVYLGEFGAQEQKAKIFDQLLQTLLNLRSDGALAWDLVDSSLTTRDAYAFSVRTDPDVCEILAKYAGKFSEDSVSPVLSGLPVLCQNYPNPTTGIGVIEFSIPEQAMISISLFNIQGQEVLRLIDGFYPRGEYRIPLQASEFASGVYFYRLTTGGKSIIRKCVIVH